MTCWYKSFLTNLQAVCHVSLHMCMCVCVFVCLLILCKKNNTKVVVMYKVVLGVCWNP